MRLVMIADQAGVRLGYELRPANEREYEPTFRLAGAHPETVLFADKGLWGREFKHTLELIGVELVTPARHRLGERPPAEVAKAGIRLVIESVFANLKEQMGLRRHLAKTLVDLESNRALLEPLAEETRCDFRSVRYHRWYHEPRTAVGRATRRRGRRGCPRSPCRSPSAHPGERCCRRAR